MVNDRTKVGSGGGRGGSPTPVAGAMHYTTRCVELRYIYVCERYDILHRSGKFAKRDGVTGILGTWGMIFFFLCLDLRGGKRVSLVVSFAWLDVSRSLAAFTVLKFQGNM